MSTDGSRPSKTTRSARQSTGSSTRTGTKAAKPAVLLSVDHLRQAIGRQRILRDISFELDAEELVVLAGRNGAGKSTLLRCLAGWQRPASGKVIIEGLDLLANEREARQHVILVPDTPDFYLELTAWEHLVFVARSQRIEDWKEPAEELLDHFGLWEQRDAYPHTFSRGMRYKLGLSLALMVEPALLLLDEPFGPIDPISAERLWSDLGVYRDAGMGILLSSHQLPPGVAPDRYILMDSGRILGDGSPAELADELDVGRRSGLDALLLAAVRRDELARHGG
ncbi:MAG TPA: ABC transporter ATP-binding protein [Thermomicrobiaceae bacterium]|nr:ABC transporter ATP-binding protein [Thermomicrobiaceae bacterium]